MSKKASVFTVVICIIGIISSLFFTGFMFVQFFSIKTNTQTITELNRTYHGSVLNITATDIKTIDDSLNKDGICIAVRFVIENKSDTDFRMGGSLINPYVDDITADGDTYAFFNEPGEGLNGTIAPGKSSVGYYSIHASKDAKVVEIQIKESSNTKVIFVFNVPSAD